MIGSGVKLLHKGATKEASTKISNVFKKQIKKAKSKADVGSFFLRVDVINFLVSHQLRFFFFRSNSQLFLLTFMRN